MQDKEKVRKELEAYFPDVMETDEATKKYEFIGFAAPYAIVRDRATGVRGSLEFTHMPRFYFNFSPERK